VHAVIVKTLECNVFKKTFLLLHHKGAIAFNLRPTGNFDKLPGKFTFFKPCLLLPQMVIALVLVLSFKLSSGSWFLI